MISDKIEKYILVFNRYIDHRDEIFAIDTTIRENNFVYNSWSGLKGEKLTPETRKGDWSKDVAEMIDQGWTKIDGYYLDVERCLLIRSGKSGNGISIQAALYFKLDDMFSRNDEVKVFLQRLYKNISAVDASLADRIRDLPVYYQLVSGNIFSHVNYHEGPLAVLLLFSLRRYLTKTKGFDGNSMIISDENGKQLPVIFEDLAPYVKETCEELFIFYGWLKDGELQNKPEGYLYNLGLKHKMSEITSLQSIVKIAELMDCKIKTINMNEINSSYKAVFF